MVCLLYLHSDINGTLEMIRMIRFMFILLAALQLTSAKAQDTDIANIKRRLERITSIRKFPMDSTGFSKLPSFDYYCDDETINPYPYYHVMDVNNDGLMDAIYSGPCMPYDQTGVFANTGNSMVCIFSYPGKVIALNHDEIQTTIDVLKEPCCCDPYFDYTEVIVHSNSEVTKNRITFESGTVIRVDDLKPIKVKGILRTTPKVLDDEIKDSCTEEMVTGNHVLIIRDLTDVLELHREKHWRLILYQESDDQSWIGWIKWKGKA